MASTDVNALSTAVRDKYISELAKRSPTPALSIFAWLAALVFSVGTVHYWQHNSGLVFVTFGIAIGSFSFGYSWLERKRNEAARDFAARDDQMLQVLHAELVGNRRTRTIVLVVLTAAIIVAAAVYFTRQ